MLKICSKHVAAVSNNFVVTLYQLCSNFVTDNCKSVKRGTNSAAEEKNYLTCQASVDLFESAWVSLHTWF